MPVPQQKFRELVFQLLYSKEMGKSEDEDMLPLLMKQLSVTRKIVRLAQERVHAIRSKLPDIDLLIGKTSLSYDFERIQSVEKNILRLGLFEILYDPAIPPKVAITEALRLAKKFSSPASAAFINAILDVAYKAGQGIKVDPKEIKEAADALIHSESIAEQASLSQQIDEEIDDV